MYKDIKISSLCENGYISQIVKVYPFKPQNNSQNGKNPLTICSKNLLQLNSKLSGVSYKPKLHESIKKKKLMIIGVDSSHIKGKRTGIAMVATINTTFTNFYNKEKIIFEDKLEPFYYCISSFIEEAIAEYKNLNDFLPEGIIIYRQGVSLQQRQFLFNEVKNIQKVCEKAEIMYDYILVNKKTTYKFFEKIQNEHQNPEQGLLVFNDITNRNFFEFYIQPQKVTGGSATPTCFTVAFGNFDSSKIIPKLTFDLCHLYSNWQGPVRVPHVLKLAEKLSKMTAKYTERELHPNLTKSQAYL